MGGRKLMDLSVNCECTVDGFGFVEFESLLFVPRQKHVKVGLDSVG